MILLAQTNAFLPLILDNIVLTQETLHWANTSKQPSFIFNQIFRRSTTKFCGFSFFHAMQRMGISEKFVSWVKLCFQNATAMISMGAQKAFSKLIMESAMVAHWHRAFSSLLERCLHILLRKHAQRVDLGGSPYQGGLNNRPSCNMQTTPHSWLEEISSMWMNMLDCSNCLVRLRDGNQLGKIVCLLV